MNVICRYARISKCDNVNLSELFNKCINCSESKVYKECVLEEYNRYLINCKELTIYAPKSAFLYNDIDPDLAPAVTFGDDNSLYIISN